MSNQLRVYLNGHVDGPQPTGIANYASGLRRALSAAGVSVLPPHGPNPKQVTSAPVWSKTKQLIRDHLPAAYTVRRAIQQASFSHSVKACGADLYHEPTLWPLHWNGPTVMTVHDLVHVFFPDTQPPSRIREIERRLGPALKRSKAVITSSQNVRNDLLKLFPGLENRLFVSPLGVDTSVFHPVRDTQEASLPAGLKSRRYFLCTGTLEPRKNLALAIAAHRALPEYVRHDFPLVIVGAKGWKNSSLVGDDGIHLMGYLGHDILPELVRHATALIFPSLYEGFGLPVLEAMASGTPVILNSTIASAEITGPTGRYVHDFDPANWTAALLKAAETPVSETEIDSLAGRASAFSWERCATATLAAYHHALGTA